MASFRHAATSGSGPGAIGDLEPSLVETAISEVSEPPSPSTEHRDETHGSSNRDAYNDSTSSLTSSAASSSNHHAPAAPVQLLMTSSSVASVEQQQYMRQGSSSSVSSGSTGGRRVKAYMSAHDRSSYRSAVNNKHC